LADYNSSLSAQEIESTLLNAIVSHRKMVLTEAEKAQARDNIGAGSSDSGLTILGYFSTFEELEETVTTPGAGHAYGVGASYPYDIYIWDALHSVWINNGPIRGVDPDYAVLELRKLQLTDTVVPATAFEADTTYAEFPYRAAIIPEDENIVIDKSMIPQVTLSLEDALSGNFAPVAESFNGGVYIYAAAVPEADVTIPTILLWRGDEE